MRRGLPFQRSHVARTTLGVFLLGVGGFLLEGAARGRLFTGAGWIALLVLVVGVRWAFVPVDDPPFGKKGSSPDSHVPPWRRRVGLGCLLLAIILGSVAIVRVWEQDTDPWGLRLWLLTLVTLVGGGYLAGSYSDSVKPVAPLPRLSVHRWERIALGVLLTLGLVLRVYRLESIPPGIFVDETNAAGDALRLLDGWNASPFGVGWFGTPLGYAYYMAAVFRVLGTTYFALKVVSLIPALLTLPALYLLGRFLFGPQVALAALAFLAFNRWHMTMSRWGWNELAPPLFHLLTLYWLLRGIQSRRLGDMVLAGVVMGLGMYTYLASRLVVLAVLVYLLYRGLVERGFWQQTWRGIGAFLLAYLLTFAPLGVTYLKQPFTFYNRIQQVSILNDMRQASPSAMLLPDVIARPLTALGVPADINFQPLMDNIWRHVRMFHVSGDYNPRHNLPGEPMLDPITGVFFGFGVLYALWRWRDHRRGLLVIGVTVPLLGGILTLTQEAPQAYRTLGVVPFVCLLAGDAFVLTMRSLWREGRRWLYAGFHPVVRAGVGIIAGGLLLAAGWWNVDLFFRRWAVDDRVWIAFSPTETAVAREVRSLLKDWDVYLSPTLYWGSPLRYLTYRPAREGYGFERPPYRLIQPVEDLPLTSPVSEATVFFLELAYADLIDLFAMYYPNVQSEIVRGRQGIPLYVRLKVPREDVAAIRGVIVTYELAERRIQERVPDVNATWPTDFPPGVTAETVRRVVWEGSLFVPRSGRYNFYTVGDLTVWIDGMLWERPLVLGKGLHRLTVVQENPGMPGRSTARLLWERPAMTGVEVVPSRYFFTVPPPRRGLLGTYYRGENWQAPPYFQRVDRVIYLAWQDPEPLSGPFSVTWTGSIYLPRTGTYRFRLDGDDGVRLWIGDRRLGESMVPDRPNQVIASVFLSAGWYPIRVDYYQRGGAKSVALYWQPPGEEERIVPSSVLYPTFPPGRSRSYWPFSGE